MRAITHPIRHVFEDGRAQPAEDMGPNARPVKAAENAAKIVLQAGWITAIVSRESFPGVRQIGRINPFQMRTAESSFRAGSCPRPSDPYDRMTLVKSITGLRRGNQRRLEKLSVSRKILADFPISGVALAFEGTRQTLISQHLKPVYKDRERPGLPSQKF